MSENVEGVSNVKPESTTKKVGLSAGASEYKPSSVAWNVTAPVFIPSSSIKPLVVAVPVVNQNMYNGAYDQNLYYQQQAYYQHQQQQQYYAGPAAYRNNMQYNPMYPNSYYGQQMIPDMNYNIMPQPPITEYPGTTVSIVSSEVLGETLKVEPSVNVASDASTTAPTTGNAPAVTGAKVAPVVDAPPAAPVTVVTSAPLATPAAVSPAPESGTWKRDKVKQEVQHDVAKGSDKETSGWKRGEKLEPDVIKRSDGVHRYDKNLMLTFYTPGQYTIPAEVKKFYEKNMTERLSIGYELNKKFGKGNANSNNNFVEVDEKDYKEEEALIFSEEKLKSTFHYDPSRLTVVTEGQERDIEKEREVTINKANLTLNKLSVEKFDKLSDEFLQV